MNIFTFPKVIQFAKDKKNHCCIMADMNCADDKEYSLWTQNIESKPSKFENVPMTGFKIIKEPSNNQILIDNISIQHPLGFTFKVSSQNFSSIITNNSINSNDEITSSMILCYQKRNCSFEFFLVNEIFYKESIKNSIFKITIGQEYLIEKENHPYFYLGHTFFYKPSFSQDNSNHLEYQNILFQRKKKSHVFMRLNSGFPVFSTFELKKVKSFTGNKLSETDIHHFINNESSFFPCKDFKDIFNPQPIYFEKLKYHLIHNLLWSLDISSNINNRPYESIMMTHKNPHHKFPLFKMGKASIHHKELSSYIQTKKEETLQKVINKFFEIDYSNILIPFDKKDDLSYPNNKHILTTIDNIETISFPDPTSNLINKNLDKYSYPQQLQTKYIQSLRENLYQQLYGLFSSYNKDTHTIRLYDILNIFVNDLIHYLHENFSLIDLSSTNNHWYSYRI